MDRKFLAKDSFKEFVEALAEIYRVYYLKEGREGNLSLVKFEDELESPVIGAVRPFESLKNFFFHARENVVDGFEGSEKVGDIEEKPFCILGVKNCDLSSLKILDYVFTEGDFKDPFYIREREQSVIIASDCTKALDTCFCHALGSEHYPEENYDILMSELTDGYLLEASTDRGKELLRKNENLFTKALEKHVEERDHIRKHTGIEIEENIREHKIPLHTEYKDIIKKNLESPLWEREIENCVECGSCNVVCPTCHCFYLVDARTRDKETRYKVWDSCMHERFARVAGGANPRDHLWQRLRNRFEKKFDFFPEVIDRYACTGCGRCFSGCPAKIDIRKILKELVEEKKAKV